MTFENITSLELVLRIYPRLRETEAREKHLGARTAQ
jgi:hypothetical protein